MIYLICHPWRVNNVTLQLPIFSIYILHFCYHVCYCIIKPLKSYDSKQTLYYKITNRCMSQSIYFWCHLFASLVCKCFHIMGISQFFIFFFPLKQSNLLRENLFQMPPFASTFNHFTFHFYSNKQKY